MPAIGRRVAVLVGLFTVLAVLALYLLMGVLATVFFAITIAYVLYPLRERLVRRGLGRRVAAGVATTVAFLVGFLLLAPVAYIVYARRGQILPFLEGLPESLTITLGEFSYTVPLSAVRDLVTAELGDIALAVVRATPVLALKAFLFTLLVYALLLRPDALRAATLRAVPAPYHDIVMAVHERVRSTLFALYVVQAATAFGTFCVALVLFVLLGYDAAFSIAVLSGILQFIPIVGPSVVVGALGVLAVVAGEPVQAALVTGLGLVFVAFLPDALIRPRLARYTAGMAGSLYFIGFTGGVLSVGAVGVIAGPLAVALLSETIDLIAAERGGVQARLEAE